MNCGIVYCDIPCFGSICTQITKKEKGQKPYHYLN